MHLAENNLGREKPLRTIKLCKKKQTMSKFSQRETEKCITFPKLQQHSENTFTSCDGSVPFQCIINITVITPGEGFLKMMCYHLAQLMDRVLPEEKKKKKITL